MKNIRFYFLTVILCGYGFSVAAQNMDLFELYDIRLQNGMTAAAAKTHFDQALSLNENLVLARNERGYIDLYEKKWDDAIKHFETSIKKSEKENLAYLLLAMTYSLTGKLKEADTLFALAASRTPAQWEFEKYHTTYLLHFNRLTEGCEYLKTSDASGKNLNIHPSLKKKCT